jgi:mannose-1-phosphate guanylyltransferase/mannose-6-phosphate isomerase
MPESFSNVYPVLLAGGVGSRLWPVSRQLFPKQLASFGSDDSLVQMTVKRLFPIMAAENVRVVCGLEHLNEIARHLDEIGVSSYNKIISEPCGRNTAPAILLAALKIIEKDEQAVIVVLPADHIIQDKQNFHAKVADAVRFARQGYVVTFGILPDYPETGYGYIQGAAQGPSDAPKDDVRFIKRFVEKPDKTTAEKYIRAGCYFWNSGMFAFKASVIIQEFKTFQSDLYTGVKTLVAGSDSINREQYARLPNISFDYAIMEHTTQGVVLPSDFGWSDIGSWQSLYDFMPKDKNGNVIQGDVIANATHNCFIMGQQQLVTANHLKNMVVVGTSDSVFVSDLENSREVKNIVTQLKKEGRKEHQQHPARNYSYGQATLLDRHKNYRVERVQINTGAAMELKRKGEIRHLIVLEGIVKIVELHQVRMLQQHETATISGNEPLSLENTGTGPLHILIVTIT